MALVILEMLVENLSFLVENTRGDSGPSIFRDFGSNSDIENDMIPLAKMLSTIRDVVKQVGTQDFRFKGVVDWLSVVKQVAYDASDAVDEWSCQVQQLGEEEAGQELTHITSSREGSCSESFLLCCFNFSNDENKRYLRFSWAELFKEIGNRFTEIQATMYMLLSLGIGSRKETMSYVTEPKVYGRDNDKDIIVDKLVQADQNLSIFSIVGRAGIGKTTLLQMVYHDGKVVDCFDVRVWIHVCHPFNAITVLKDIFKSFKGFVSVILEFTAIQREVIELLRGKRYLIVLDDMWNEDVDEWNRFTSCLKNGAKGSVLIVTTRLSEVASITSSTLSYCLLPLSDIDCWSLFKTHAFTDWSQENQSLVALGKKIVERCKGVPQAAKDIGSFLRLETDEKLWRFASQFRLWESPEDELRSSIRTSFYALSPLLRLCFAYCCLFPKDRVLKKHELIGLWIANGFIPSNASLRQEDIGNDIFNELLRLSFFRDPMKDHCGNIVACEMEEDLHILASSLMVDDCLTIQLHKMREFLNNIPLPLPEMRESLNNIRHNIQLHKMREILNNIRHLSLICESMSSSIMDPILDPILKSQPSLRSLFFFQNHTLPNPCMLDFSSLRCLRALHLRDMSVEVLSPSLFDMKHLRYLNLSKNRIMSLPESINKLRFLQVLDVSQNKGIRTLPPSIGDLQQLRHFDLSQCSITSIPEAIGALSNLLMLDISRNEELTALPDAVGDLHSLRYFNLFQCSITSLPDTIHTLSHLVTLDMSRNEQITALPVSIGELLSLSYLGLSQCQMTSLPESITNLRSLEMLDLSGNYSITSLPVYIGQLQSLRTINLSDCNRIRLLPQSVSRLTNLQALILRRCSSLVELPEKIGNMKGLRHLEMHGCNRLTKMPDDIAQLSDLKTLDLFIVGRPDRDGGSGIGLLYLLNNLNGELEIRGLENVRDSENASDANLRSKYDLSMLKIVWGNDSSSQENLADNVLNGLLPPFSIKQLMINGYPWPTPFPCRFLDSLHRLQSLNICNCMELASLPEGLHKLTSLEELQVDCCNSIQCLPVMGIQGLQSSLLSLTIESCNSLTSVSEGLMHLTSLKTLSFQHCPELELTTTDFQHLISLQHLKLGWLIKLKDFPHGMQHLSRLRHLEIEYCWNLTKLPEGMQCLRSLKLLKIHYCPDLQLVKEDFQHLLSLQTLEIEFLPKLTVLPEGLQDLTMLKHLKISRCENLRMLPEGLQCHVTFNL